MKSREVILVFGRTGSGKSTLAKKLTKRLAKKTGKQVLVFDFNHEYEFDNAAVVTTTQEIERELENEEYQFVVFRIDDEAEEVFSQVNEAFRLAWRYGEVILVVDEADFFIASRDFDIRGNYFLRAVQFGRHREIDIICCSRRVVELNIFVRAQYTKIYTFKQTEPRDIKRLVELGFSEEQIRGLERFKYLSLSTF